MIEFTKGSNADFVEFSSGTLSAGTYSYCINSSGHIELTEEETYQLYQVMKKYYED